MLVAEIEADLGSASELATVVASLAERARREDDMAVLAALALRIEHFYTAVETLLLRIAKVVDGVVPDGDTWHQRLLKQASLEVADTRPPCLSRKTVEVLRPLLAFRHFLRHAYAVQLDRATLLNRAREVASAEPAVRMDIRTFVAFLEGLLKVGSG